MLTPRQEVSTPISHTLQGRSKSVRFEKTTSGATKRPVLKKSPTLDPRQRRALTFEDEICASPQPIDLNEVNDVVSSDIKLDSVTNPDIGHEQPQQASSIKHVFNS